MPKSEEDLFLDRLEAEATARYEADLAAIRRMRSLTATVVNHPPRNNGAPPGDQAKPVKVKVSTKSQSERVRELLQAQADRWFTVAQISSLVGMTPGAARVVLYPGKDKTFLHKTMEGNRAAWKWKQETA